MWRASMALDPATAVWVDKRITDEVDRLFADGVPDDAPDDPIERQQYLAALAVLSLLRGEGGSTGRPEVIVVVDATQVDGWCVDWGLPVDVPARRAARTSPPAPSSTSSRSGLPPISISAAANGSRTRRSDGCCGRCTRRVRSRAARCGSLAARCITSGEWEHGGPTDLDNLLPICNRHHQHFVHDKGWKLKLLPDRTLEITLPDGETMTTGPPSRGP